MIIKEEEQSIFQKLFQLAYLVTDGRYSCDFISLQQDLIYCDSVDSINSVFLSNGIKWGTLVEYDIRQILMNEETKYFKTEKEWVHNYLSRRGISSPNLIESTIEKKSSLDQINNVFELIRRDNLQIEKLGAAYSMFIESGYACLEEQRCFYTSPEWKAKAESVRFQRIYQCEHCGQSCNILHVHHSEPIMSMFSDRFFFNFQTCKLKVLCRNCHKQYHSRTVRDLAFHGYYYADIDEIKEEKTYLKKIKELHDQLENCEFCSNKIGQIHTN